MTRGWLILALGGVCAVAACSDQEQAAPTAPQFKQTPSPYPGCDFNTVKNLVTSYFSPPALQTAQGYETLMESTDSTVRRENGFKIMDLIGQVSRSTSPGSTSTGSSLTKALTKCMFDTSKPAYTSLANGAGIDGVAFDLALSPTTGGVYYVVGAGYDFVTTTDFPNVLKGVIAGTYSGNGNYKVSGGTRKSAVGPATLSGDSYVLGNSWATNLSGNTFEGGRALVYGYQSSTSTEPLAYEWATIDPLTTFDPYALVSVCEGTETTLMVHESGVGVLAFSTADLCNTSDATGTATGFRSNFKNADVQSVHLDWILKLPAKMKVNQPYPAIARATTTVDNLTTGVNGACLLISGSNNNGQPLTLTGSNECNSPSQTQVAAVTKTDATYGAGTATFTVIVTKTGGITFTLSGYKVLGRTSTFENTPQSKSNVGP